MAIHDPESTAHERAMALKVGRQKRIQIINGQQVEVMDDDDEDDDEHQVIAVEGEDGQQYVVLEVIQLQDGDGQEQTVALVGDDHELTGDVLHSEADMQNLNDPSMMINEEEEEDSDFTARLSEEKSKPYIKQEVIISESDVKNCFGFDDSDDEEETECMEFFNPMS
jgi:hypothetical protein